MNKLFHLSWECSKCSAYAVTALRDKQIVLPDTLISNGQQWSEIDNRWNVIFWRSAKQATIYKWLGRFWLRCSGDHVRRKMVIEQLIEWFSNRTGTSLDDGARSKNTHKELGRQRRRVLTEMWFSNEVRRECPCSGRVYSLVIRFFEALDWWQISKVFLSEFAFSIHYLASDRSNSKWFIFVWSKGSCLQPSKAYMFDL